MIDYPNIDPVAVNLGFIKIYWYGISYVFSIVLGWWLLHQRAKFTYWQLGKAEVADLVFYAMLGIIIGGRLGSVIFYNLPYYLEQPMAIFYLQQGGMSFHGGLLGVIFAIQLFARKINQPFLKLTDFIAPVIPIGLGAGRIGNFINGELWGTPSDLPWAMVFPNAGEVSRHPSQLYEFFLEGLILFIILWCFSAKPRATGAVSGLFLLCYGVFRFAVELVRAPNAHIGYIAFDWLTMGQLLSIPMLLLGGFLLASGYKKKETS